MAKTRGCNRDEERMNIYKNLVLACKKDADIVARLLELGDRRLCAGDGPVGGQPPDLDPEEWGKVYRACLRISKRLSR